MDQKEFEVISQKSEVELEKLKIEFRDKLWNLKKDLELGKVKNIREIKSIRKDIARVLTVLNSKRDLLGRNKI